MTKYGGSYEFFKLKLIPRLFVDTYHIAFIKAIYIQTSRSINSIALRCIFLSFKFELFVFEFF